jgi:GTP-binding protein
MNQQSAISNQESNHLSILRGTDRSLSFVAGARAGRGMCISKVRVTARRGSTPKEGEQGHFLLELRTIADAGFVGYPNAGKSTLLRKVSAARPRVAAYPFTTLHPIIGVAEFSGYRRATIADIPGLIEGAHRGLGLGHEFLRHITRCRIFLFVVDVAGSEGRNPVEDLQQLRKELDLYDPLLSQRPWFVIANKMDLPGVEENLDALRKKFPRIDIVPVSAAKGEGIEELKKKLARWLEL